MAVTAETLLRHEVVGLDAAVTDASNPSLVGIAGEVVRETTNTLGIAAAGDPDPDRLDENAARRRQVPKADATVAFRLPDGQRVRVDGERLVGRPARRTERSGDSKWR
jgi:ribonuclease P protein subunit POP4